MGHEREDGAPVDCAHRRLHPGRAMMVDEGGGGTVGTRCLDCGAPVGLVELHEANHDRLVAELGPPGGTFDRALAISFRDVLARLVRRDHVCLNEVRALLADTRDLDGTHVDMGRCPTVAAPHLRDDGCPTCRDLGAAPATPATKVVH